MTSEQETILLGGQAVIEGVMMRGPKSVATAVRRADGEIVLHVESFVPLAQRSKLWSLPLFRGAGGLVEMLALGIRMLNFSAEIALADSPGSKGNGDGGKAHASTATKDALRLGVTVIFSLALAGALFIVAPLYITTALLDATQSPFTFNLVAGGVRLLIFLGYLLFISQMKDVKRLFMYHGAEHKTVFAYERERLLTVDAALRQSRFHPRCGTSFLLVVMIAAIMVFSLTDTTMIMLTGSITLPVRLITHLMILPLVGGFSYEVIRFSAKHAGTLPGKIVIAPGLWLQRITTREPDREQIDVALVALRAALNAGGVDSVLADAEVFDGPSVN
jgi:uncharacterized protein YqhQ